MRKTWTKQEEELLCEYYRIKTPKELEELFQISWHPIKCKAHKLGLNRVAIQLSPETEQLLLEDYKKLPLKELRQKYSLSNSMIYKFVKASGLSTNRTLTDFGDVEEFKMAYQQLSKGEIEKKYQTSFFNIKNKAHGLGLLRPTHLITPRSSSVNIEQLKNAYMGGQTIQQLADQNNLKSRGSLGQLLRKHGLVTRVPDEYLRRYTINQSYFKLIDTPDKAYFLGLLAADGCILDESNISIGLQEPDGHILEAFRKYLLCDKPLALLIPANKRRQRIFRLSLFSQQMVKDLAVHSLFPRKSLTMTFPSTVPETLMSHYLRGYFDGDGTCTKWSNIYVGFCGTKEFLSFIWEWFYKQTKDPSSIWFQQNSKSEKNVWSLSFLGKEWMQRFYNLFYYNCPTDLYLFRKRRKFEEFLGLPQPIQINIVAPPIPTTTITTPTVPIKIDRRKKSTYDYTPHKDKVEKRFQELRAKGFPYQILNKEKFLRKMQKMNSTINPTGLIGEEISCNSDGTGDITAYFPHIYEMRCFNSSPAVEIFNDDKKLMQLLYNRARYAPQMSDADVRRGFRLVSNGQLPYNFKPRTAQVIYETYGEGVTWDPCFGFGGRLLGASLSKKITKYIGTDPHQKTFESIQHLWTDIKEAINPSMEAEFRNVCAEDFIPVADSLDFIFTSPPYFNAEQYSTDSTQCFIRYPTPEQWMAGFFEPMIKNCWNGLKDGKYLIINVANVPSYKTLEQDALEIIKRAGFNYLKTLKMMIMRSPSNRVGKEVIYRFEPIFICQKPLPLSPS